jgi:membrane-bound lytic murein transglycosylase D
MFLPSLAMLAHLAAAPAGVELPMPPPPPGLQQLPAAEAADDPEVAKDVDEQSAELEELKALEEVALDPAAQPDAEVLGAMRRLGFGNPLRHRLQCAFDPVEQGEGMPFELAPVTDLASFDVSQVKGEYDIPVEMQPLVAQYIRFFQGPGRRWFRNWMSRSTRYVPMMHGILTEKGLPKDTIYLAMIESGFSAKALSWARAVGPWQFMPATGKEYHLKQDFWVDERRDPVKSTVAAATYLARLYQDLGDWYLAWAGYNAGGNRLRYMVETRGTKDWWQISEGKGLMKETQHYVPKLIACALVAKHLKAFGFTDDEFDYQPPLEFDEVPVPDSTDLEVLARAAGLTVPELQDLNPELKRWCTPPGEKDSPYLLRIPKGATAKFTEAIAKLGPRERLSFKVHRVKKGDTLSVIARNYGSAPEAIMRMNGLKSVRALRVNTDLVVPVPSATAAKAGRKDSAFERQVAQARRSGYAAARPEEEIPAGAQTKQLAQGPVKTEQVGGKTRVTYGVQSGDSLWTIARHFDCTVDELRGWNSLPKSKKSLKVGSLLFVFPGEKKPAAPKTAEAAKKTQHTVAKGETLASVAKRYRVSVDDLRRWNGLKGNDSVKVGQALTLVTR